MKFRVNHKSGASQNINFLSGFEENDANLNSRDCIYFFLSSKLAKSLVDMAKEKRPRKLNIHGIRNMKNSILSVDYYQSS